MLKFKTYITEIFDKIYPLEVKFDPWDGVVIYKFKTDLGKKGSVNCLEDAEHPGKWQISFDIDNQVDITGGGDAYAIFATVIDAINRFIKEVEPNLIEFSAMKNKNESTSRIDLYNRMVVKMAGAAGYTYKKENTNSHTIFTLTKRI